MANLQNDVSVAPRTAPQVCIFLLQLGGPKTLDDIEPFLSNLIRGCAAPAALVAATVGSIHRQAPHARSAASVPGDWRWLAPAGQHGGAARCARSAPVGARGACQGGHCDALRPPACRRGLGVCSQTSQKRALGGPVAVPAVLLSQPVARVCASWSRICRARRRRTCVRFAPIPSKASTSMRWPVGSKKRWPGQPADVQREMHLVFSAHGLPMKLVREGDPVSRAYSKNRCDGVMQRLRVPVTGHTLVLPEPRGSREMARALHGGHVDEASAHAGSST